MTVGQHNCLCIIVGLATVLRSETATLVRWFHYFSRDIDEGRNNFETVLFHT